MDAFLRPALDKLLKDCSKRSPDLRAALASAVENLGTEAAGDSPADGFLEPLLLACESKQPKMIVTALDCLQKLMSYGYLRGNRKAREVGLRTKPEDQSTVMDVVVRVICSCEDTDGKSYVPDDSVQLQVIKALLTAVTCATCGVHETSLLNSVRACYHIHLYSRNTVNKTTAKATLTQMMNAIFQQMELVDAKLNQRAEASERALASPGSDAASASPVGTPAGAGEASEADAKKTDDEEAAVRKPKLAMGGFMYAVVAEAMEMPALVDGAADAPAAAPAASGLAKQKKRGGSGAAPFRSIQHKDAYLLFRALCKLSMKNQSLIDGSGTEPHVPDPVALRSKVLSLDLVLNILDNSGPAFRRSKDFVYAIKTYLCSSLIKNCVSSNTQVVGLSLRIFVALQTSFARYLKAEIELVISKIFLPILESSNSPHEHKVLVLEVILQICKDVETLVSIFLNYDCDWDSIDLYSRIVQVLSRIASEPPGSGSSAHEDQQRGTLHAMSLKSVVSIVESLAEFSHLEDQLPANGPNGTNPQEQVIDFGPLSPGTSEADKVELPTLRGQDSVDDASVASSNRRGVAPLSRGGASTAGETSALSSRRLKVDSFQQKQRFMRDVATAAAKFNIKPKRGIEMLVDQGYIEHTPEDVATALLEFKDTFSKTMIGDYLGEDKEFNVQTMHAYVEGFDFKDMLVDDALRLFLSGFRLPGEAQKIDRMMEKFAARYLEDNPNSFPSADTCFVLAFSVIMLQTDLHNPNIPAEKKMSKPAFLSNNRGIAGGRDLDPEFLGGIYDRIKSNPFTLAEDEGERNKQMEKSGASGGLFGSSREASSRRKRAAFSKERQEIVQSVTSLLGTRSRGSTTSKRFSMLRARPGEAPPVNGEAGGQPDREQTSEAEAGSEAPGIEETDSGFLYDSNDHVPPMFAVTWAPFCAVFSVNLQNMDEFVVINTAVDGMKAALRVACRFGLEDERKTLFDALIKFTLLNSTQEMKAKHITCVQALIEVVQSEGDYLGSSWVQTLMCLSQLSRMQLVTSGGDSPNSASTPQAQAPRRRVSSARRKGSQPLGGASGGATEGLFAYFQNPVSPAEQARITDEDNAARLIKSLDMIQIDRIFLDSVNLSTSAIVDMVHALCEVSRLELCLDKDPSSELGRSQLDNKPRIFSLQKIVEVADSNMDVRPRFVWGRIWAVLSKHFAAAGCHRSDSISMYAIDSLRQLSVKFLEKDELAGFNFQLQFMDPFREIMGASASGDRRDLVLRCIENIILSRSRHLRSGWSVLLNVLAEGGQDASAEVSSLAFAILQRVVKDHLPATDGHFEALVASLSAFASNTAIEEDLSLNAFGLMETALEGLLRGARFARKPDGEQGDGDGDGDAEAQQEHATAEKEAPFVGLLGFAEGPELEAAERAWPLICAMLLVIGDKRRTLRERALEGLFGRLRSAHLALAPEMWELVLQRGVLALTAALRHAVRPFTPEACERLFARAAKAAAAERPWNASKVLCVEPRPAGVAQLLEPGIFSDTTLYALMGQAVEIVELLREASHDTSDAAPAAWRDAAHARWASGILTPVLWELEWLMLSDSEAVANVGVSLASKLLTSCAGGLEATEWRAVRDLIVNVMRDSTPQFLTSHETRAWLHLEAAGAPAPGRNGSAEAEAEAAPPPPPPGGGSEDTDVEEEEEGEANGSAKPAAESGLFAYPRPNAGDALPFNTSTSFIMCSVQLQLLQLSGSVLSTHLDKVPREDTLAVLDVFDSAIKFAHEFNDDLVLRIELQKRGFMHSGADGGPAQAGSQSVPTLLRQETLALSKLLSLLFKLDAGSVKGGDSDGDSDGDARLKKRLEAGLHMLFMHYLFQDRVVSAEHEQEGGKIGSRRDSLARHQESEAEVDLRFFTPVVLLCLREVLEWDVSSIQRNLAWLYPLLTALLDCGNREVHSALRQIFDQHISALLGLGVKAAASS